MPVPPPSTLSVPRSPAVRDIGPHRWVTGRTRRKARVGRELPLAPGASDLDSKEGTSVGHASRGVAATNRHGLGSRPVRSPTTTRGTGDETDRGGRDGRDYVLRVYGRRAVGRRATNPGCAHHLQRDGSMPGMRLLRPVPSAGIGGRHLQPQSAATAAPAGCNAARAGRRSQGWPARSRRGIGLR